MKKTVLTALAAALALGSAAPACARELRSVGISLGTLGNPFFIALSKGAEAEARKINPKVKVRTFGFDYDLFKQFTQIDNFIAVGVDMIILNPGDANAVAPAIRRAQAAGIVVIAVDTAAKGADATVTTDNVKAGELSCQFIVDKLGGKGDVVIQNGPQVSAVVDRVTGCKKVFAANPGIKVLSADQDGKGSRDGGLNVMQGHLTRFQKLDAVFTINDPQAIGADLAARQLERKNILIASVDGAPDIEAALKGPTQVQASASQDPFLMAEIGVRLGYDIMNGKQPEERLTLVPPKLITRDNVGEYRGWQAPR